jgi:hypothetical protein
MGTLSLEKLDEIEDRLNEAEQNLFKEKERREDSIA